MIDEQMREFLTELQEGLKSVILPMADIHTGIQDLLDAEVFPVPEPPKKVMSYLKWNYKSPWPFPTQQDKEPPVERVKWITLHHSAGQRDTTSASWWNKYHTETKRWPHVGYHFGIVALNQGDAIDLYQMNRIGEFTWHDSRNWDTLGVCIAGDLRAGRDGEPTSRQIELAARLLAWLVPQLPNFQGVTAHELIQSTQCPGDIETWGNEIVAETKRVYGLDLTGKFNVRPTRAVRSRMRSVFIKSPPSDSYEDV